MVLKTCRCCCSTMRLEKASKIIAIIFTILGGISLLMYIVKLFQLDAGRDELLDALEKVFPDMDAQQVFDHARTMAVLRLVSGVLFTLFSALLLVGVYRASKPLVLAFVVFFVLYLAAGTAALFYSFYDPSVFIDEGTIIELRKMNPDMASVILYSALACALAIQAFFWYLAIVVYSFYREMATGGSGVEHRQLF